MDINRREYPKQRLLPEMEAASGTSLQLPNVFQDPQHLDKKKKAVSRHSSVPLSVRFEMENQDTVASAEFEQKRKRRMSDPGSLGPITGDDKFDAFVSGAVTPGKDQADIEREESEWGMFVEAPRWEDWQDFAMHGTSTSPVELDNEEEALKRLRIMSPYISRILTNTALNDPDIPLGEIPSIQSVTGAVMIADVSGFTTLTERALTSKRGNELVEELTACMNNYFDEAVDLVIDYGGDTIKYAGDSIIVFFPVHQATSETQASCALRAVGCGFDLISCLGAYTPELGGYGNTSHGNDGIRRESRISRETPAVSESLSLRGYRGKEGSESVTILIVDDIMLNRVVLSKMLSKLNCEVVLAANGREAVKAHSKQPFDAIFMDVHMPMLDGIGASHLIRRSGRPKTPIIGVCTRVDEQLRKECLAAGMDELLAKPVTMSQLVAILRTLRATREHGRSSASNFPVPGVNTRKERQYSGTELLSVPSKDGPGSTSPLNERKSSTKDFPFAVDMAKKKIQRGSQRDSTLGAIQHPSSAYVDPDASLTLALKVLIGIGQVCMLSVGGGLQMPSGLPRWEYFIADLPAHPGSQAKPSRHPMEQLRCCEEHARSGTRTSGHFNMKP